MPRLALLIAVLATLVAAAPAGGQSEGTLRDRIGSGKARERSLAGSAARLGQLERKVSREVAVLEGRLADAQAELDTADAKLAYTAGRLVEARKRVNRLRERLSEVREQALRPAARALHGRPPGLRHRRPARRRLPAAAGDAELRAPRRARRHAAAGRRALRALGGRPRAEALHVALAERREREANAVRARRDALAGITAGLRERREFVRRAHAARIAALGRARSGRQSAERELRSLLAARARAAVSSAGPGGPWAIPWAIVQCESGGQNVPPNSAGASGYYQFMQATWKGLGGSTKHAYQAPKAEQDRLAARLWAGGAGAHNWVCASLVDEV